MLKGLQTYLKEKGFPDISSLKNKAVEQICPHEDFPKTPLAYPQINHEVCTRCGKCVTICAESEHQALHLDDGYVERIRPVVWGAGYAALFAPQVRLSIFNSCRVSAGLA